MRMQQRIEDPNENQNHGKYTTITILKTKTKILLRSNDARKLPLRPSFVVKRKCAPDVNAAWKFRQVVAHEFFERKAAVAAAASG